MEQAFLKLRHTTFLMLLLVVVKLALDHEIVIVKVGWMETPGV